MIFHLRSWQPETNAKGLVFIIHGLSDHGGRFVFVAESLVKEGYVCVVPDLRGNGNSGGKRGHFSSMEQIIDDLDFLVEKCRERFKGLPLIIYGQSMGGNLALHYGVLRQKEITCIISSSPWIKLTTPPSPLVTIIGKGIGKLFPSFTIPNGINPFNLCQDKVICQLYADDPLIHGKITLNTFNTIQASGEWVLNHAEDIKIPILLMHGTGDKITLFEASRQFALKNSANCTFIAWEAMLHELHNEIEKEKVLDQVLTWLRSINVRSS